MKPYQKPPIEAQVMPATEMMGRPQRPQMGPHGGRGPPPHYKSRPGAGLFGPGGPGGGPVGPGAGGVYPVPAPRSGPSVVSSVPYHHTVISGSKMAKPMARYHPSLSGSETDVSTSTENLTQVNQLFFET